MFCTAPSCAFIFLNGPLPNFLYMVNLPRKFCATFFKLVVCSLDCESTIQIRHTAYILHLSQKTSFCCYMSTDTNKKPKHGQAKTKPQTKPTASTQPVQSSDTVLHFL